MGRIKTALKGRAGDALIAGTAAAMLGFLLINSWTSTSCTDTWFFYSTGRYICENGIPHENPFAAQEGLKTVVQQWAWCVASWKLHELAGANGLSMLKLALDCLIGYLAARLVCEHRGARARDIDNKELLLVCAGLALAQPWLSQPRPHLLTCAAMLISLIVCERVARGAHWRELLALPLLMCAHMQVHMSMAWLDVFVVGCHCLPRDIEGIKALRTREGRRRAAKAAAPFAAAALAMVAVMPLNPYGTDGVAYVFNSMGAGAYRDLIEEMRPIWETGAATAGFLAAGMALALAAPIIVAKVSGSGARTDLLALSLAACAATCMHVRSGWICAIAGIAAVGAADWPGRGEEPTPAPLVLAAAPMAIAAAYIAMNPVSGAAGVLATYDELAAPLVEEARGDSGEETPLVACAEWVDNAYLEMQGLKVLTDSRPELWEPGITGSGEHLNNDYFDAYAAFTSGDGDALARWARSRGASYLLVNKSDGRWETALDGLEAVAENEGWALARL